MNQYENTGLTLHRKIIKNKLKVLWFRAIMFNLHRLPFLLGVEYYRKLI